MYSKRKLIAGFSSWLELINYVQSSIDNDPKRLAVFLDWMKENGVTRIDDITGKKVKLFFEALATTKSNRTGKVLSLATQRNYLTTINRFAKYLRQSNQGSIEVPVKFKGKSSKHIELLTKQEMDVIYEQCDDSLLGIRDRAMLAVFYGCGVRRNEAERIEVKDVLPDRNLLYIGHGKGGKQRYVPIVGKVKRDILIYMTTARPMLLGKQVNQSLFIGIRGMPLRGPDLYERFKKLLKKSGIKKKAGLHTLRHSIATQLLINGMSLKDISKFLGHSSLESTQIYTHLKHEI